MPTRSKLLPEPLERRLFLSASALLAQTSAAGASSFTVLSAGMTTPEGYSTPNGAPITPAKMRGAYGLGTYGSSNVTFNGVQGDGSGQTIALVEGGDDPDIAADVTAFDQYWNLPNPPSLQELNATGGTTLPGVGDVGELDLDVEWAHVMAPGASIVIYCGNLYTGINTAKNAAGVSVISVSYGISGTEGMSEFETPSGHTGVTVTASTGDTGGEVVDPAKSPAVVAVGGTDLYTSGNNWSSETAWSAGGGGINTAEGQPAYQNGVVSAYSTTQRTTPDVAMDADPGTGVAIYDEYDNGTTDPWAAIIGGTSLSSPLMAGIIAVADQGRVAAGLTPMDGYTQTLPRIYKLASADFHDITSGSNGHSATAGYDLATGLGSPVGNKFIPDLAGADTITGKAYVDVNSDGIYDTGDTVLAGKTVYLDLNKNGIQDSGEPTATTNSSGGYVFSDQIGSETGIVRLAAPPTGMLATVVPTNFTTSYDTTQTVNLGFETNPYTPTAVSPVTGTTSALSVTGTTPPDASSYIFTWSATNLPSGAVTPTFSANGTSTARNTVATFSSAGTYILTLTVTDGFGDTSAKTVNVVVSQKASSIAAAGGVTLIGPRGSVQYSAFDQFGNAIAASGVTWNTSGGGTISSSGLFTPSVTTGGTDTVSATANAGTASTSVTLVPTTFNSTGVGATYIIRISPTDSTLEQIWVNTGETSTPTYTVAQTQLANFDFAPTGGSASLTIDYANGNPIPTGSLAYAPGMSGNALSIKGASAGDMAFNLSAQSLVDLATAGNPVGFANVATIAFDLTGGNNTLTQTSAMASSVSYNAGAGSNTLNIKAGTFLFGSDPQTGNGSLTVNNSGALVFSAGSGTTYNARHLAGLNLSAGATVSLANAGTRAARTVLVLGSLTMAPTATIDLKSNDLLLHNGDLSTITPLLVSGYNGGKWTGTGITSSTAATDTTFLTAVGAILNNVGGSVVYSTFDGQSAVTSDVLIRYTYVGDANLDGQVDGSDYTKIDNGYNNQLTGWLNGDFNYDGVIDGSDYTLIDNAFNMQGGSLGASSTAEIATPAAMVAKPAKPAAAARGTATAVHKPTAPVFSTTPIQPSQQKKEQVLGGVMSLLEMM